MVRLVLILPAAMCGLLAHATDWNAQDYDLYPGDFNADGKSDVLYVARDAGASSGIALSDGQAPNVPWQSWSSSHLGIQWHGRQYTAIIADYNNDGRSDVLMQRVTPGDNFLLLADASGRLTGISQTIGYNHVTLSWSKDQHTLVPGDFNGDGPDDLFFQAAEPSGVHGVPLANASGLFTSNPAQTFTDSSFPIFKWSRRNAVISSGDFNGDGRDDLLVQNKPTVVLIDYEIPIPVPVHPPNAFGVVYSQGGTTPLQVAGVQQWNRVHNGVDWSPNSAVPVIGDFNGDGRDDVLLQARRAGQSSFLMTGNAAGPAFSAPTIVTSNVSLAADGARLLVGNFGGTGGAGLYVQSTAPGGLSYVAPSVGAAVSAQQYDSSGLSDTESVSYGYDARGRLIRVLRVGGVNNNVQTQYTYDKANNRKTLVTTGSGNAAPP
jgi:YD repeat-containing protein